jgi:tetratricopeptide (TPR) repeat protein
MPPVDFGPFGRESMSIAVDLAGAYRFGVRAADDSTAQGWYEIRWSEKRPVQPDDFKRVRAQAAFAEAQRQPATSEPSSAKAITLFQEAGSLWAATGDRRGEASAFNQLGIVYDRTGHWESAYDCYTKALHIWESLQDEYRKLETLRQLGRLNWHLGERFSVVPSDEEFLRLWKRLGDRRGEADALEVLSGYYIRSKDYVLGIDYANKALAIQRVLDDQRGQSKSLEGLVTAM